MEIWSNVLITWLNGVLAFFNTFASPVTFAVVTVVAGFLAFAFTDVEELDRQGGKPVVGQH